MSFENICREAAYLNKSLHLTPMQAFSWCEPRKWNIIRRNEHGHDKMSRVQEEDQFIGGDLPELRRAS